MWDELLVSNYRNRRFLACFFFLALNELHYIYRCLLYALCFIFILLSSAFLIVFRKQ